MWSRFRLIKERACAWERVYDARVFVCACVCVYVRVRACVCEGV